MDEIHWGLLVAFYLFLAGAGAGALFLCGFRVLNGQADSNSGGRITRATAIMGTLLLMIGTTMILFDLASFQFGLANGEIGMIFRFIQLFMTFQPESMMSIGSWLLSIAIICAILFSFSIIRKKPCKIMAVINMILAVCVASYTAFLLGDITHNIVWNNSVLVIVFMASALSCGAALLLQSGVMADAPVAPRHTFEKADVALLVFELICVLIFAYSVSNTSVFAGVANPLAIGATAGTLWWMGAIGLGLVLPLLLNIHTIASGKKASHGKDMLLITAVLLGAFCLRYSVLIAGQTY